MGAKQLLLRYLSRKARPYLRTYGLLQTAKIFNKSAIVWEPGNQSVLVLAPHMDDETIGCGGALAAHASRGSAVTVVFLTDCSRGGRLRGGEGGRESDPATPEELIERRRGEARRALAILGVQQMIFLGAPDGDLAPTPELVEQLHAILLDVRPSLIYLPCFLEEHPDHRAVSDVLLAATESLPFEVQCLAYEVWTPLFPNCFVNIDGTMDAKRRAISEYATQLADSDYLHTALGLNAYRSSALLGKSCSFAEAFLSVALSQYRHLYEDFRHAHAKT
ncbi:MAG TPA: PIG-L deacetylase family protein [Steroidobacteraceae bacterium]|nr:PIG-L deacetylase family protein [Steroidobacteraceae bacterium]